MRARHATLTLALALAAGAPSEGARVPSGGAPVALATKPKLDAATAALQRNVEQLRRERGLASGNGFYLRLDAATLRLSLRLQGVTLDDYPAERLQWGVPQVVFVDRRPTADWDLVSFSKGRLEPQRERDRIEIVAPPLVASGTPATESASPSPPPAPKSAEESYSVPSPYRIVFAEGISLEVRSAGHGGRNRSLVQRLADATRLRLSDLATALGFGTQERIRLRLTLSADDAAALYRSLPPGVGLIVVGLPPR